MQRGELFHNVKLKKPVTNAFDMSHQLLTTGNMGNLIPILCQEVVPGDRFRVRSEIFCRLMPMLHPIMQRVDIYTHYFFVPNRLLWNISKQTTSWEAFITGGKNGDLEPEPPHMQFSNAGMASLSVPVAQSLFSEGSLWDYFGLPTIDPQLMYQIKTNSVANTSTGLQWNGDKILLYPFLAYQLIYDEYYRDQNYTDPVLDNENMRGGLYNGELLESVLTLRKRSWKKDYFTSALPWAQRALKPVSFPLGGTAPVNVSGIIGANSLDLVGRTVESSSQLNSERGPFTLQTDGSTSSVIYNAPLILSGEDFDPIQAGIKSTNRTDVNLSLSGSADLSNATAITVQLLREGLRLQEWLERNSVGGARYVEQIYAHFGVMVPDATMQRPIYLGGGKQTIRISEVLSSVDTTVDDESMPLGSMAGHGVSVGRTQGFNGRQFLEHGFIIGIMSVMPKASYMNGVNKMWTRFDKLDYYFPEFAHLGEQEVKISELNFRPDKFKEQVSEELENRNDDTFGYQSRYAEYKYSEDKISGAFRSSLLDWHLGRNFDRLDQFDNNVDFLEVNDYETERIFAVQDDGESHKLLFQIFHDMQAIRPMPKFATPYI